MKPALRSYSVVVPTLNRRAELDATLQSIVDSMAFFEANHPCAPDVAGEVIVVDEGSTDGTPDIVRRRAQDDSRIRLVEHDRSFGIGPARNTGVRMSHGDVLFFCDGDDRFLPEHVFVGFSVLDGMASTAGSPSETIRIRVGAKGHLALPTGRPVAAVRTGVHLKDAILPEWHAAVQGTIAQCLCVRRECHDWIEGFPQESIYQRTGSEDGAYAITLETFFRAGVLDIETVEYTRRPGNGLDRQMMRFTHPMGSAFDVLPASEQGLHTIRARLERERIDYLLDKWLVVGPPPLPPPFLNWRRVVEELVGRGRIDEASGVAADAGRHGVTLAADVTAALDRARLERRR